MTRFTAAVLLAAPLVVARDADAMFRNSTRPVPVKRLLENVGKLLRDHPDDARIYYVFAHPDPHRAPRDA
jgi:hypothetical protein